jgi:hypothetical protein
MNINFRRIFGTASAVAVLIGTGAAAAAVPASAQTAQPWPHWVAPASVTTAKIATVFDLDGRYTGGGSARPRITDVSNVLTVDMSSQHRPTAVGLVLSASTIVVTFPDVNQSFQGTLVAPGRIVWDNNTEWLKLPYVPNVTGDSLKEAVAAVAAAGFTAKTLQGTSCGSGPLSVSNQAPMAGTQADFGSQVRLTVSNC